MGPFNCVQGDDNNYPTGSLDTFCDIFLKYYNAVRKPSGFALRQGDSYTDPTGPLDTLGVTVKTRHGQNNRQA